MNDSANFPICACGRACAVLVQGTDNEPTIQDTCETCGIEAEIARNDDSYAACAPGSCKLSAGAHLCYDCGRAR